LPDTFHIVTEAPVGAYIQKQYVEFSVLIVDDLLPWCAELKAQGKRIGLAKIDAKMPAFDRWRAEKWLEENEPTIDNLQALVSTIPGAKRVLLLSLKKAGRPDEEAAAVVAAVPAYQLAGLAIEVSRLLPPALSAGGTDPNAGAGNNAGEKTGPE
jgi:hypothetical protein